MMLLLTVVLHLTEPLPAPEPSTQLCSTDSECMLYCIDAECDGGPE